VKRERDKMNVGGTTQRLAKIEARPDRLEIDLSKTALIVVDMQNAFAGRGASPGTAAPSITGDLIGRVRSLIEASRAVGVKVVYLTMMKDPKRKSKSLISSVGDTRIIEELTPLSEDVVIEKSWYSGFRETPLDSILKGWRIEHLVFSGVVTNVCVESTLRDSYFLDYLPILVSDATNNAGPSLTQAATEWNVQESFGWVTTTEHMIRALSAR
jgi:ureidoacrylate peracid hydrolase